LEERCLGRPISQEGDVALRITMPYKLRNKTKRREAWVGRISGRKKSFWELDGRLGFFSFPPYDLFFYFLQHILGKQEGVWKNLKTDFKQFQTTFLNINFVLKQFSHKIIQAK
jgi:hypothetical protein